MASGPSHEATLTSTEFVQIFFQQDNRYKGAIQTHIDGADPFSFLLGTECPPFSPHCWFCTGVWIVRTRRAYHRPENGQSDGKNLNFTDGHVWECQYVKPLGLFIGLSATRIESPEAIACIYPTTAVVEPKEFH